MCYSSVESVWSVCVGSSREVVKPGTEQNSEEIENVTKIILAGPPQSTLTDPGVKLWLASGLTPFTSAGWLEK